MIFLLDPQIEICLIETQLRAKRKENLLLQGRLLCEAVEAGRLAELLAQHRIMRLSNEYHSNIDQYREKEDSTISKPPESP